MLLASGSIRRLHCQIVVLGVLYVIIVPVEVIRGPGKVIELVDKVDSVLPEVRLHETTEVSGGYVVRGQYLSGTLQERADTTWVLNHVNGLSVEEWDEAVHLCLVGTGRRGGELIMWTRKILQPLTDRTLQSTLEPCQ